MRTRGALLLLLACSSAPAEEPADDVTPLTVLLPRDAEELDPRFVTDPYGLKVSRLLSASLVTIDPRTLEVVPDLAEHIEVRGDRTYRVVLRRGLRFADGSPLTSADVVATYQGVVSEALGSVYARTYRRIARVEAIDPRRVEFELEAPHATFMTDLELPVLPEAWATRRLERDAIPDEVVSGPYRLRRRDTSTLELEANPRWHHGNPRWQRLRFVTVRDDNTRALRLLAGAGDVALSVPPMLLPLMDDEPGWTLRSAPGVSTAYLGFHTEVVPLEVREAIAQAVDRALLVETELDGRAHVTETWIPQGHWAHVDLPPRAFDPGAARARIEAAGWQGRRLRLRVGADRFRVSVARAIAAMLREVGLEVEVRPSETASLIADLNRGAFDLCILQVPEVFEPHVLSWFFGGDRVPTPERPGANRWRLRDEALDAALERGRANVAMEIRRDAYRVVQERLHATLPVLPLWQEDTVMVVREGLELDVPRDGRFGTLAR